MPSVRSSPGQWHTTFNFGLWISRGSPFLTATISIGHGSCEPTLTATEIQGSNTTPLRGLHKQDGPRAQ